MTVDSILITDWTILPKAAARLGFVQCFLKVQLSIFINIYAYKLNNSDFFKELTNLRDLIITDINSDKDNQQATLSKVALNLNFINDEQASSVPGAIDLEYLNKKYKKELASLRSYPVPQKYWGLLCFEELIPSPISLIEYLSGVKKIVNHDFQILTHDDLKLLGSQELLKKAIYFNHLIPSASVETLAGFGLGNPKIIIPINNKGDIPGNIIAALNLLDQQAVSGHLAKKVITDNIKNLEELLWGMFYYYQEFNKKLSQEKCMELIGSHYDAPISESRFKSGKNAAKKYILKSNSHK